MSDWTAYHTLQAVPEELGQGPTGRPVVNSFHGLPMIPTPEGDAVDVYAMTRAALIGQGWLSVDEVARKAGLPAATVDHALKELVGEGSILVQMEHRELGAFLVYRDDPGPPEEEAPRTITARDMGKHVDATLDAGHGADDFSDAAELPADGLAETAVKVCIYGHVEHLTVSVADDRDLQLNMVWQVDSPDGREPLIPSEHLLVGRVLDLVEHHPDGSLRRTLWRMP